MKLKSLFAGLLLVSGLSASAQTQNATVPKDAPVDVFIFDAKHKPLPREVVLFRSLAGREYHGLSDSTGRFSVRLPQGDKYDISILGFKDSTSYTVLDIPALDGNSYYKDPFKVDIEFTPAKSFVLEDLNFDFGKSTLQPGSETVLDELVAYLNRKTDDRIEVGGHTDNVGSAASNLKLSEDRALAVVAYLESKGIDPSRLEAKGYGMTVPIESNKTEDGRAANRRTEVKIL